MEKNNILLCSKQSEWEDADVEETGKTSKNPQQS